MNQLTHKVWEWMKEHYLLTTFLMTMVADFWANWYSYAIVHDWIVLQAFLGLALPFINFPAVIFFFNHESTLERFKICAVGGSLNDVWLYRNASYD